jgi:hypothetical protein
MTRGNTARGGATGLRSFGFLESRILQGYSGLNSMSGNFPTANMRGISNRMALLDIFGHFPADAVARIRGGRGAVGRIATVMVPTAKDGSPKVRGSG